MTRPLTAADHTAGNRVLPASELAIESDTLRGKVGDGVTAWRDLPYTVGPTSGRPKPSSLVIASHSYEDPGGVIATGRHSIGYMLTDALGMDDGHVANLAISGSMARNHFTGCSYAALWQFLDLHRTAAPYVPDLGVLHMLYGTNDAIRGTGAEQMAGYAHALLSMVARAQSGSVFQHDDAAVTRGGGTWNELLWANLAAEPHDVVAQSPATPWGGGTGCWRTRSVGAWIEFAVPADHTGAVDLFLIGSYYGAEGIITVDTESYGLFDTSGLGAMWLGANLHDERNGLVKRVTGLTLGVPHAIRLIVTAVDTGTGTNPGEFRFDSASIRCVSGSDPLVLLAETPIIPEPAYFWAGVTPSVVREYNRIHRLVAALVNPEPWATWPVMVVPTQDIATIDSNPDGAGHPNNFGAALFAGEVAAAYNRSSAPACATIWPTSWATDTASTGTSIHRGDGPPTGFTDTFNRGNSTTTLGDPWIAVQGTWGVNGSAAYLAAGIGNPFATDVAMINTSTANGRVQATIGLAGTPSDNHGILFRGSNIFNFLSLVMSTTFGGWVLRSTVGGVTSTVANIVGPWTVGTVIAIEYSGTSISVYFNGALTTSGVKTTALNQTGTYAGLVAPDASTLMRWDSFTYGPAVAGASNGDYYLDTAGPALYGPYADGDWGDMIALGGGDEAVLTNGDATGTVNIDCVAGNVHALTLTGPVTLAFAGAMSGVACFLTLYLRQDVVGARAVTFPASVHWPNGTTPTFNLSPLATNIVVMESLDGGSTWYASLAASYPGALSLGQPITGVVLGGHADWGGSDSAHVTNFQALEATVNRHLRVDHLYAAGSTFSWPYPAQDTLCNGTDRMAMITWEPTDNSGTNAGVLWSINNGLYDTYLRARAAACASKTYTILLRPMHEMNGDWLPWSPYFTDGTHPLGQQSAADYIAAYRRIHDIFRGLRGGTNCPNVAFIWCPNLETFPNVAGNQWADYYPGDAYVDWCGYDAYNWGSLTSNNASVSGSNWVTWDMDVKVKTVTDFVNEFSAAKPIMAAEMASADDTVGPAPQTKAAWLAQAQTEIKLFPKIGMVVYFSAAKERNWQLNSVAVTPATTNTTASYTGVSNTGATAVAARTWANDPYYLARPASAVTFRTVIGSNSTASATSTTITNPVAVPAGRSIFVAAYLRTGTGTITVTDSAGNTYAVNLSENNAGNGTLIIASAHNVTALPASGTITVTSTVSQALITAGAVTFDGLATTGTFDVSNGDSNASSVFWLTTDTAVTAQATELAIGAYAVHSNDGAQVITTLANWDHLLNTSGINGATSTQLHIFSRPLTAIGTQSIGGLIATAHPGTVGIATYKAG